MRCRCFGAGAAQIGPAQILRNVVLPAASAAGLAIAAAGTAMPARPLSSTLSASPCWPRRTEKGRTEEGYTDVNDTNDASGNDGAGAGRRRNRPDMKASAYRTPTTMSRNR